MSNCLKSEIGIQVQYTMFSILFENIHDKRQHIHIQFTVILQFPSTLEKIHLTYTLRFI